MGLLAHKVCQTEQIYLITNDMDLYIYFPYSYTTLVPIIKIYDE